MCKIAPPAIVKRGAICYDEAWSQVVFLRSHLLTEPRYTVLGILEHIHSPEELRAVPAAQLPALCQELRAFLLQSISETGGHFSSNLGAVELTVALHRVYDTARDRLVFDVGHQCYVHKLLTGRREDFHTLRQLDGLSGFPKPVESIHDAFIAGHASNSVSAALGMARARTALGEDYDVVALIGDGALTGGLAYEGLSDAGSSGEKLVVVLNDNGMSIEANVGGIARLLGRARVRPGYLAFKNHYRRIVGRWSALYRLTHSIKEWIKARVLGSNMFEDMGFYYLGPVDGHDSNEMEKILRWARGERKPVLVHALTTKGKGCAFAEEAPGTYHGVSRFDPETGETPPTAPDFSSVFGETLTELAQEDKRLCAITAAMVSGTGLSGFAQAYPERFFDVGIAEGHAAVMAAGMAKQGMRPVFAVYSSFLQRAYDMLIHDVSLQRLHVVFGVDRAGLVGRDGETHHGVFDVSYLCSVPHMTVLCPASFAELRSMLRMALYEIAGPVALRYPRGGEGAYQGEHAREAVSVLREGRDLSIVCYGTMLNEALLAAETLAEAGVEAEVVKLGVIRPLDTESILASVRRTGALLVAEESCANGCVGERLAAAIAQANLSAKLRLLNLGAGIVPQGDVSELRALREIDAAAIAQAAMELTGGRA